MNFPGDFRSLGTADISALRQTVLGISDAKWNESNARQQNYGKIHQYTQTIGLIYDDDMRHKNGTVHAMYHELKGLIEPIEKHVAAYYQQQKIHILESRRDQQPYFARIILVLLKAGGVISKHKDGSASMLRCHRIHLPLVTGPTVTFDVGESSISMAEGELWEINNRREHAVANNSDNDRIHLVLDYVIAGEKIRDTKGFVIC